MPPVMNRAEGQVPAALRPAKAAFAADPRHTDSSADKKTAAPAPSGSIAAIESLLGC